MEFHSAIRKMKSDFFSIKWMKLKDCCVKCSIKGNKSEGGQILDNFTQVCFIKYKADI